MSEKSKKICSAAVGTFSWLLFSFAIFIMIFTIVMVATVDRIDRTFLGLRFYIVQSDSMSLSENNADDAVHFNAGDIIFSKKVEDTKALEKGTVISFISTNSDSYGKTLTHRIRETKRNSEGKFLGYVTYGTNTGANDEAIVMPEHVLGEYAGKLAGVGNFFAFVKTIPGYLLCVLAPILLLILYNGINAIRSFKAYKKEQRALIDAERIELDQKIKENEEMLRKIEALKQELAEKNGGTPPMTSSDSTVE